MHELRERAAVEQGERLAKSSLLRQRGRRARDVRRQALRRELHAEERLRRMVGLALPAPGEARQGAHQAPGEKADGRGDERPEEHAQDLGESGAELEARSLAASLPVAWLPA